VKQLFNLLMVAAICGSPAHAATAGDTTILRAAKIYTRRTPSRSTTA